ncbi:MAG: rRNA maturation RNase YbeY [Deltaproteobacteria bacterium]|nr:MAG: rRNA maturation RNase YbeY [Deltaproteobacteria bacterium]
MEVTVQDRQKSRRISPKDVRRMAERILDALGLQDKELSVLLTDDDEITELNRRYLRRNRPTNVIAFPMEGPHPRPLGDVVISTETAKREAEESGIEMREEVALLLAHGILHLLGYDHEGDPEEARRMEEEEERLVKIALSG